MATMKKFMVVHSDPNITWGKVQKNWVNLAKVKSATWLRTCFNREKSVRYCVWLSPDEETLKAIFNELDVSWQSILEVKETVPDLWGKKWEEHLAAEAKADTLGF